MRYLLFFLFNEKKKTLRCSIVLRYNIYFFRHFNSEVVQKNIILSASQYNEKPIKALLENVLLFEFKMLI